MPFFSPTGMLEGCVVCGSWDGAEESSRVERLAKSRARELGAGLPGAESGSRPWTLPDILSVCSSTVRVPSGQRHQPFSLYFLL